MGDVLYKMMHKHLTNQNFKKSPNNTTTQYFEIDIIDII